MNNTSATKRIVALFDMLRERFESERAKTEAMMRKYGIEEEVLLVVEAPYPVSTVPTFDPQVALSLTPMLSARFGYCGTWNETKDLWLGVIDMKKWMKKKVVRSYHSALRKHWDQSAPMLFPDSQLSLFGVSEGVRDNLTYLVWTGEAPEPEVWSYEGMDSNRFKNLQAFLKWNVEQE